MTRIEWSTPALADLDHLLMQAAGEGRSRVSALEARVKRSCTHISSFPMAARYIRETDVYEKVVVGEPMLLIYRLAPNADGEATATIVAAFHTSQDPTKKRR